MKKLLPFVLHPWSQLFILCAAPIPFFCILFAFFQEISQLHTIEERFTSLHTTASTLKEAEKQETLFLSKLKQADHFYIDKQIETLRFLQPEIDKLKAQPPGDQQKRLHFLEHENTLVFAEEHLRKSDVIQEVEERQLNPIQVNEEDLKLLLSKIEHPQKDPAPQLIVKQLRLTKKKLSANQAVFVLTMHLIKREGLSK